MKIHPYINVFHLNNLRIHIFTSNNFQYLRLTVQNKEIKLSIQLSHSDQISIACSRLANKAHRNTGL